MSITDRIGALARRARESRRRVWSGDGRTWVELRGRPDPERLDRIIGRLQGVPGITWARWNAPLARLVIAHDAPADAVIEAVREAERACGAGEEPFLADPPKHPGDTTARTRSVVRAAANVASVGIGAALGAAGGRPDPMTIDLAALSQALENLPAARRWVDDKLGGSRSDLLLGLANSASSALARGATGQAVDLVSRGLRLMEIRAQQDAWRRREPELGGRPEDHPGHAEPVGQRPGHLPRGPIEKYSDPAGMASLGGFGFGVAATGKAERAAASILGAVPKPARVGREAFGATLGRDLAQRGVVITDNRVLRRLDRLDTVVLPGELLRARWGELEDLLPLGNAGRGEVQIRAHRLFLPEQPDETRLEGEWALAPTTPASTGPQAAFAARLPGRAFLELRRGTRPMGLVAVRPVVEAALRALVAQVRRLGLGLLICAEHAEPVAWAHPDEVVAPADLLGRVRELQSDDHGVLLVTVGDDDASAAADLSLALHDPLRPTPWRAHLVGRALADVELLLEAVDAARRASRQSAWIAGAEAVAGLAQSLQGQKYTTIRRIMATSGLAGLGAVLNGVRVARQVTERTVGAADRTPWHALEPDEAIRRLATRTSGLSSEEAEARRHHPPPEPGPLQEFSSAVWQEIASPFAPVLATGAGLSALVGSPIDAGLVVGTVLASGLVSGWQQVDAARAVRALERARPVPVRVWRDGDVVEVTADALVPGDVIELEAGDRVPADARILEAERLETDESSLTGESVPVPKSAAPTFSGVVAERSSMLYADTVVAAGHARAVVVAVGAASESRRGLRPLQGKGGGVHARLEQLMDLTGPSAALAGLAVVGSGLLRNRPAQEMVDAAVSLAVAAVPETLPLLATAAQLAAARRLSERGALVRNVAAVEALGRVDLLCADKTGTLTEGVLRLRAVSDGSRTSELDALDDGLRAVLRAALLASPPAGDGPLPHPTDRALVEGAAAVGVVADGWERLAELPFEPARGYHATAARRDGKISLFVKGAPESILPRCDRSRPGDTVRPAKLEPDAREALLDEAVALAGRGWRVLAVAERPKRAVKLEAHKVERLVFRGFVAIADPVRPTARGAIDELRRAGVDTVMITGDHPATARAIARELGLDDDPAVLTGPQLERMTDAELDARLPRVRVFARVTPQLKVRLVEAYRRQGRVVAMTGDGANDAPAIRLADVGIALGERATAAARGAADLLVTDERIETLVDAVLEGRAMWASVRDAVSTLLGGNLGEMAFTVAGGMIQGRAPLAARQLMLVNLLTDALPALMIAVRPPSHTTPERLMGEGPERSLGSALERDIAWRAAITAGSTFAAWAAARPLASDRRAGTVALLTLVGTQLGQTLWVGWRNPPVVVAVLASGALLVAVVQTPGVSGAAGSTPLGPVGLAQAGVATVVGTVASGVLPPAFRWLDRRYDLAGRVGAFRRSDVGRLIAESRVVRRLREARPASAEPPPPLVTAEEESA